MSGMKKLRLALIIIVDGVLIAHQQTPLAYSEVSKNGSGRRRFLPTPLGQRVFPQDYYLHETSQVHPSEMRGPYCNAC